MTDHKFPLRARAISRLTVEPPLDRVVGFNKDGTPRVTQVWRYVMPGQIFYITDERMLRQLIDPERHEIFAELVSDEEGEIPYVSSRRRVLGGK